MGGAYGCDGAARRAPFVIESIAIAVMLALYQAHLRKVTFPNFSNLTVLPGPKVTYLP